MADFVGIQSELLQIINEDLGQNAADLFVEFYDGYPLAEQLQGAYELLSKIVGQKRAREQLRPFYLARIPLQPKVTLLIRGHLKRYWSPFPQFLIGTFLLASLFYLFRLGGSFNNIIVGIFYLISAALLAITPGMAAFAYGLKYRQGKVMLAFFVATICAFIGQVIWFVLRDIYNTNPFPSLADGFYFLGYILILVALVSELRTQKIAWKKISPFKLLIGIPATLLFGAGIFYFEVYLAYMPYRTLAGNFFAMVYGLMDMFLLIPIILILRMATTFQKGMLFRSWLFIFIAEMMILIGDLLFAVYAKQYANDVWPYTLIGLVWLGGNLLGSYGFYYIVESILSAQLSLNKNK